MTAVRDKIVGKIVDDMAELTGEIDNRKMVLLQMRQHGDIFPG